MELLPVAEVYYLPLCAVCGALFGTEAICPLRMPCGHYFCVGCFPKVSVESCCVCPFDDVAFHVSHVTADAIVSQRAGEVRDALSKLRKAASSPPQTEELSKITHIALSYLRRVINTASVPCWGQILTGRCHYGSECRYDHTFSRYKHQSCKVHEKTGKKSASCLFLHEYDEVRSSFADTRTRFETDEVSISEAKVLSRPTILKSRKWVISVQRGNSRDGFYFSVGRAQYVELA